MSAKSGIREWLNQISNWLLTQTSDVVTLWLISIREHGIPQHHDYIEALIGEYAEMRREWSRKGISESAILLSLLFKTFDILKGIGWLMLDRLAEGMSLFLHANDTLLTLNDFVNTPRSASLPGLKRLLRLVHYASGNASKTVLKAKISLSPSGQVIGWYDNAQFIFRFHRDDILTREAISTIVPAVDSSGGNQVNHFLNVCSFQNDYSLNVNQNQDAEGNLFWMLWANVPIRNPSGEIIELLSVGMKTQDPVLMKFLVTVWRGWRKFRCRFPLRWRRFQGR
jgi:hypothetical protein